MKLMLGTVQFGLDYGINSTGRPSLDTVAQILKLAAREGINLLDTSVAYGDSEEVLGKMMPSSGGEFKVVSKYPKCDKSVEQVIENSLRNLGQKSTYGYLLHHFDVYKENQNVWREFEEAKENGLVEKIGFSLYSPKELELIFERGDKFDLVQFPYNIFDRQFAPYMEELKKRGVEIHVRSTFLQGLFFKDVQTLPAKLIPMQRCLVELKEYAASQDLSVAQVALNFNLQNPNIDGVLIGVDNIEQLDENIKAIKSKIINFTVDIKEPELLNPVNWK